jgi:hypothetical protein
MNRKIAQAVVIVVVLGFIAGCRTVREVGLSDRYRPRTDESEYTVTTMLVHLPNRLESELSGDLDVKLPFLFKEKGVEVKQLPPLYFLPGETQEVNGQATYTFPSSFNSDGSPAKATSLKMGALYRVTLNVTKGGIAELDIQYDNSRIKEWKSYGTEDMEQFRTYPICQKEQFSTSMKTEMKKWCMAGKIDAREKGRSVAMLVYVSLPQNNQADASRVE